MKRYIKPQTEIAGAVTYSIAAGSMGNTNNEVGDTNLEFTNKTSTFERDLVNDDTQSLWDE